jgi:hypothetical protein
VSAGLDDAQRVGEPATATRAVREVEKVPVFGNVTVSVAELPLAICGVRLPAIPKSRVSAPRFTTLKSTFFCGAVSGVDSTLVSVIVTTTVAGPPRVSAPAGAETTPARTTVPQTPRAVA